MENHTEAISFANGYFTLVDGLVSGLESRLSEDVVLYWFGSLIKGREHVSTFLRGRKLNSRHIFSHIISTTDISYEKERLTRNKLCSCHYRKQQECQTRHDNFVNDNSAIVRAKCSRKDKHDIVQFKYVEANGEIEFSRKFWKLATLHTWRRPCKLQIAYTISSQCQTLEQSCETKNVTVRFVQPKVRLPSLQEINEIANRLVPNTNKFGGLLKDKDFFEDYKDFVENAKMDPCMPLSTVQYVQNKLVLNKPSINMDDRNGKGKKKFVFNYQIHLIIYQDIDICNMNECCTILKE